MLKESFWLHLQRCFRHLADAFHEAEAAVTTMSIDGSEPSSGRRRNRTPSLRAVPRPTKPASELDQQRAKAILERKGITLTEMNQ